MNDYKSMYHYLVGRTEGIIDTLDLTTKLLDTSVKSFIDTITTNEELIKYLIDNSDNCTKIIADANEKSIERILEDKKLTFNEMVMKSTQVLQDAYAVIGKTSDSLLYLKNKSKMFKQQTEEYFDFKEEENND